LETSKEKANLRRFLLENRDAISFDLVKIASKQIQKSLRKLDAFRQARIIAGYYPIGSEVKTQEIMQEILADGKTKKTLTTAKIIFRIDTKEFHGYAADADCWKNKKQTFLPTFFQVTYASIQAPCPPYIELETTTANNGAAYLSKQKIQIAMDRAQLEGRGKGSLVLHVDVELDGYISRLLVNGNSFSFPLTTLPLSETLELEPFTISKDQSVQIADKATEIIEWKKSYPNFSVKIGSYGGAGEWVVDYEDKVCSQGSQTNAAGEQIPFRSCSRRFVIINARTGAVVEVRNMDTKYFGR